MVTVLAANHYAVPTLWTVAFGWFLLNLSVAWGYRPGWRTPPEATAAYLRYTRAAVIVPVYNERPDALLATLASLDRQTRPPDTVFVVDDGSADTAALHAALDYARDGDRAHIRLLPQPTNRGKRFAQAAAWAWTTRGDYDVWLFVDSDTTLADDAVEHMLGTFANHRVNAATSLILPRNHHHPFAPFQAIEYAVGILADRAGAAVVGAVPVMSGGFCAVRDRVVRGNVDRYLDGWWGQHIGDDRHLATLAGMTGRVITQFHARSYTTVPTTVRGYLRQRVRWARSAWVGQLWTLRHTSPRRWMWWVIAFQALRDPLLLTVVVGVVRALPADAWPTLGMYLVVLTWVRGMRFLGELHPRPWVQFTAWLLAPAQLVVAVAVLLPVRTYALLTARRSGWLTR